MNTKLKIAIAAIAASGAPLVANAGGFYVGAGIGSATYESSEFVDCFGSNNCDSFSDNDFAYNIFAGYQVTDAVAVELGYQDWGKGSDTIYGEVPVTVEPSMITLMAVGTAPITENLALFGKAGIAFLSIDGAEGASTFTDPSSGSSDSEDLALGGGVQWNIGDFGVRGEMLWVDAEDADKAMMFGVSGLWKFGG